MARQFLDTQKMNNQSIPPTLDQRMSYYLDKRVADQSIRELRPNNDLIDFCSNDYLGFAHSRQLAFSISQTSRSFPMRVGSTGSRLISGNHRFTEDVERNIADFHQAEAALIYNSGYDANLGFFACVPRPGDHVFYDELIHASVHDGLKMNRLHAHPFPHNDTQKLEEMLQTTEGVVFVAVESVYSMDGDLAPLQKIADLCQKYKAHLVVDEAHGTGVIGRKGVGLVSHLGLQDACFARIHTFSKALGTHGAAILGSTKLRQYLINFSRPFIYTTALPFHSIISIHLAYEHLKKSEVLIERLHENIRLFKQLTPHFPTNSDSPIQSLLIAGNERAKHFAEQLQAAGFDVRAILYPTVAIGAERLRICLHASNTPTQITQLAEIIENLYE